MNTVTFYRVDLTTGITVEERPPGFYRGNADHGVCVFKNLRKAKAVFGETSKREIQRLHALQRAVRPLSNRAALKAHAYSEYDPRPLEQTDG